ncbi:hypothetical protein [Granulicella arctica]|uniref:hypothetical protein n=1 Tax=Granulicella arctica TaxID=940613 RepID=UPI0021DFA2A8|nr:hypothetical protein [Granulicella arctica]
MPAIQGPAFALANADVERSGDLADGVCTAILSHDGEIPIPVRVQCTALGGQPSEQEFIEDGDASGKGSSFAKRGVKLRYGVSEERVAFDGVFGQNMGGYSE